jgi:hypothetical protein
MRSHVRDPTEFQCRPPSVFDQIVHYVVVLGRHRRQMQLKEKAKLIKTQPITTEMESCG